MAWRKKKVEKKRKKERGLECRVAEEALKKPSAFGSASGNLPSPPREHEESPGKRPPRSANACLQANAAAAAGATLTHL